MNDILELLGQFQERNLARKFEHVVKFEPKSEDAKDICVLYSAGNSIAKDLNSKLTFNNNSFENSPFLSKLLSDESIELPENLKGQLMKVSDQLNIGVDQRKDIEKLIKKIYISRAQSPINVSISVDHEVLIYVQKDGTYKNILINEDGDIELLIIPVDKSKSYNKTFYKEDGLNFSKVVSAFNDMQ